MGKIRVRDDTEYLFFDFRVEDKRCREQTTLKDTLINRRKMEKVLERIERDIVTGIFDYSKFFPESSKADQFLKSARAKGLSVDPSL
jgi:integrase